MQRVFFIYQGQMKNSAKRQFILEAAAKLFRERGYAASSMRDLAKAVDLKASSLYNHIASKQEILKEICFQNAHRFLDGIQVIEQGSGNSLDKLQALLALHLQIATEDITSIISFNDEWRHLEASYLQEFIQLRKEYENRFKAIIEQGIQEGSLKAVNTTIVFNTFLSAIRWVYDWYKPEGKKTIEDISKAVQLILLDGLKQ